MGLSNGSSCAAVVAALGMIFLVAGCAKEPSPQSATKLTLLDPKMAPPPATNAPVNVAACARSVGLILHSPGGSELAHDALLLLRQLFGCLDLHLDDQITGLRAFVNAVTANAKALP